jgi:sterol desaturase/sphingolipid hydroxylase (fatty acid hydroxylase superfamily)
MGVNDIFNQILEGLELPFSYFLNPKKRIYLIYGISSFVIAYFVFLKIKKKQSFFSYIFNKKIWLSKSAIVDYKILFLNGVVKSLLIGPFLIYGLYISFYTNEYILNNYGYPSSSLTVSQTIILYTISLTIISDLTSFIVHYLLHKVPFLWEFHKIHHSATTLNPITQYRLHPVELIINNARAIIVFGVITGLFDYLSDHQINEKVIFGVNIFGFLFMFLGANLRHSHVPFKYPNFLEHFLISPLQHQVHHSNDPAHFNKNMGSKFAVWDWIFGTLVLSKTIKKLTFGLGKKDDINYNTFSKNLYKPFTNILNSISKIISKKNIT